MQRWGRQGAAAPASSRISITRHRAGLGGTRDPDDLTAWSTTRGERGAPGPRARAPAVLAPANDRRCRAPGAPSYGGATPAAGRNCADWLGDARTVKPPPAGRGRMGERPAGAVLPAARCRRVIRMPDGVRNDAICSSGGAESLSAMARKVERCGAGGFGLRHARPAGRRTRRFNPDRRKSDGGEVVSPSTPTPER